MNLIKTEATSSNEAKDADEDVDLYLSSAKGKNQFSYKTLSKYYL